MLEEMVYWVIVNGEVLLGHLLSKRGQQRGILYYGNERNYNFEAIYFLFYNEL